MDRPFPVGLPTRPELFPLTSRLRVVPRRDPASPAGDFGRENKKRGKKKKNVRQFRDSRELRARRGWPLACVLVDSIQIKIGTLIQKRTAGHTPSCTTVNGPLFPRETRGLSNLGTRWIDDLNQRADCGRPMTPSITILLSYRSANATRLSFTADCRCVKLCFSRMLAHPLVVLLLKTFPKTTARISPCEKQQVNLLNMSLSQLCVRKKL